MSIRNTVNESHQFVIVQEKAELSIESPTATSGEIIRPSGPHVKIPESLKLSNEAYTTYKVCNKLITNKKCKNNY